MLSKKETELLDALEPRAASEGIEIVTVQVVGAKKAPTIRVFIDTPEGVSFDELAKAQAWINDIMDALDPFPGAYTLEAVSYTHLDVYKRQLFGRMRIVLNLG